jgi:hypothetical protein
MALGEWKSDECDLHDLRWQDKHFYPYRAIKKVNNYTKVLDARTFLEYENPFAYVPVLRGFGQEGQLPMPGVAAPSRSAWPIGLGHQLLAVELDGGLAAGKRGP